VLPKQNSVIRDERQGENERHASDGEPI